MAAIRPAADTDASQHFRLVPYTDLSQLNSVMEHAGKIFNQFSKVHPTVSREKEEGFAAVKTAFHIDELHLKPVIFNFLLADHKGFLFTKPILLFRPFILFRGNADNRAQRLDNGCILYHTIALRTLRNFKPFCSLDNDFVSLAENHALRRKVIALSAGFEFYANNFCQFILLFCFPARIEPVSNSPKICFTLTFTLR